MKRRITKLSITKILIFTALFLSGRPATANVYFTVNLDSVSFNDTIIYCSGIDSIKIISPTGSANLMWIINQYQDTIFKQNLVLPGDYKGEISCQYSVPVDSALNFSFYPFSVEAGKDLSGTCGNNLQLNVKTNLKGSDIFSYLWSSEQVIDNPIIPNPIISPAANAKYYITVTTLNGCHETDSVNVILSPVSAPKICIVGVNDLNKNLIIWEKPALNNIDSVFIFKETFVTDQYRKIGAVGFENGNSFIDTLSYPDVQSNKYKVSLKDICGMESDKSAAHKTLHLSINRGQNNTWNLIWESYEGFQVTTYNIYRGIIKSNLELIGSSPASNTQYSDLTPPENTVYYQIEIVSPNDCSLLKSSSYNVSRSNIASYEASNDIYQITDESQNIEIYPNPGKDEIIIKVKNFINCSIEIINTKGSIVMNTRLFSLETKLNISNILPGIYFVKIITEKEIVTKKLIKK
ncbi:MAG: T9SS type A sorting domain-containing protein [Ignavibacteriaceae bacterium]|jgi:hypothetical protein|nr:T9SS type A sorting domain-containing protein [Ignavibacteriaceae bacterium]